MDTWILLRDVELNGERNRSMYILKSRGMAHSNQLREFLLTPHGIELRDVYTGAEGVLTGSARLAQEAREHAATLLRQQEIEAKQRELERQRQAMEAQIASIRLEFEAKEDDLRRQLAQQERREQRIVQERLDMARRRRADADGNSEETDHSPGGTPS
jgi:circadian clock protein KaiC